MLTDCHPIRSHKCTTQIPLWCEKHGGFGRGGGEETNLQIEFAEMKGGTHPKVKEERKWRKEVQFAEICMALTAKDLLKTLGLLMSIAAKSQFVTSK